MILDPFKHWSRITYHSFERSMPIHTASLQAQKGVYTICPTPFTEDGAIDIESIGSLVEFLARCGVHGLAILGFLGEAHKLAENERTAVIDAFVAASAGRLPIWVGVRALGTAGAIEQAQEAEAHGASAVFVAPLSPANDAILFEHYTRVARAVKMPVIIHDFPASFGTVISPDVITRLGTEGGVHMIKMEEVPVLQKLSQVHKAAGEQMRIFGGLGGVYFLEELQRGAVGTMTGFAFPEILVAIYEKFAAGEMQQAARIFDRYCSLIRYEFQPRIGLALRKHIYRRRGAIASEFIRSPGARLDPISQAELEALVERQGLELGAPSLPALRA